MLLDWFPNLNENKLIIFVNKFLYSKYYIFLIGILILLCNILAFEIYLYYFLVFVAVVIPSLLCKDFTPILAPLAMTYSSVSLKSNNTNYGTSLLKNNQTHFIVWITLIAIFLLARTIMLVIKNPNQRIKPALLWGYLLLGPCYVFGGLLSPYWDKQTAVFGLVAFLSISGCYFILLYAIKWNEMKKDYFAWIMSVYGIVIAFEILYIFIQIKTNNTDYVSDLGHMFTGWGMRNNIAGQLSLCIAAPIYLGIKNKKISWFFILLSCLMISACALTNSRGGLITSAICLIIGLVLFFKKNNEKKSKLQGLLVLASFLLCLMIFIVIKRDNVGNYLSHLIGQGIDNESLYEITSGRDKIWYHGLEHFMENELLGVGFFQCKDYAFQNFTIGFVPPRYHNIYIQFLASTGLVGLTCYFIHRYQTFKLAFKRASLEKTFVFLSIAALIISSFTDNHFFNLGPGLNYCIALVFIEGLVIQEKNGESANE